MARDVAEITTEEEWAAFWVDVEASFNDIEPIELMGGFMDAMVDAHLEYFSREESPTGEAWEPLAVSTVQRKGHDTILLDTGRLVNSLVTDTADSIREEHAGDDFASIIFGTSVPYSIFHTAETGREHIGINDDHLDGATNLVADRALAAWMES